MLPDEQESIDMTISMYANFVARLCDFSHLANSLLFPFSVNCPNFAIYVY